MIAPLVAPNLINRLSVLLCLCSDGDMLFVSSGFFDRVLSQPGGGDLVVTEVRFDVTRPVSSGKGDSVRAGLYLMASGVTDAGNRFPLTTAAHSATGGYRCSGWLVLVMREAEPVATPIRVQVRTVTCSLGGELTDFGIVRDQLTFCR